MTCADRRSPLQSASFHLRARVCGSTVLNLPSAKPSILCIYAVSRRFQGSKNDIASRREKTKFAALPLHTNTMAKTNAASIEHFMFSLPASENQNSK